MSSQLSVLPEDLITEVQDFLLAAFTAAGQEGVAADGQPTLFFSHRLPGPGAYEFRDFTIRARHFRCVESFFVLPAENGQGLDAVISLNGLDRAKPAQDVQLVAYRRAVSTGDHERDGLVKLLEGLPTAIYGFVQPKKLRFPVLWEADGSRPVGGQCAPLFRSVLERAGYMCEARLLNEGGPGRHLEVFSLFLPERPAVGPGG